MDEATRASCTTCTHCGATTEFHIRPLCDECRAAVAREFPPPIPGDDRSIVPLLERVWEYQEDRSYDEDFPVQGQCERVEAVITAAIERIGASVCYAIPADRLDEGEPVTYIRFSLYGVMPQRFHDHPAVVAHMAEIGMVVPAHRYAPDGSPLD